MQDKRNIRQQMRALMSNFDHVSKEHADKIIARNFLSLEQVKDAQTICTFVSRDDEVDTKFLYEPGAVDKRIIVPKILGEGLALYELKSIHDLERGPFSIWEPKGDTKQVDIIEIDLFVVPGLAFTRGGARLGHGTGFYDKLLSQTQKPRIGLAYSFQIVSDIEQMSYDVSVTNVITEKEIISI